MTHSRKRNLIEGQPVLVAIDIQGGESAGDEPSAIPFMPDYQQRMARAPGLIEKARACDVPIAFFQKAHRRDLIDFGRELDGAEDIHLLEGDPGTEIAGRVVEDCVAGSSWNAHEAALRAMEYLQTGARRTSVEVMAAFEAYKQSAAEVTS